jgi:hypothetical protein
MRVIFLGNFAPAPWGEPCTEAFIAAGLRAHGVAVHQIETARGVRAGPALDLLRRAGPADLVLVTNLIAQPADWFTRLRAATRAPVVMWHQDLMNWGVRESRFVAAARHFALVFGSDAHDWGRHGLNHVEYLPGAVQLGSNDLARVTFTAPVRYPVSFIGQLYEATRKHLLAEIRRHVALTVWGRTTSNAVYGPALVAVVQQSGVVIHHQIRTDIPGYWSNRVTQTLGAGGLLITPPLPGLSDYYRPGVHLATTRGTSAGEYVEAIRYWLARSAERDRVRRAGHQHVMTSHTWRQRAGQMLAILRRRRVIPGGA